MSSTAPAALDAQAVADLGRSGRVALDGVTKRFGKVTAVSDVSLDVHDGEFLVLLGPSGCGKSTLLRLIAGLEDPTDGTITIGDRVVNDIDPKDRDVAMVFQTYALYPHMTVAGNIEFPLRSRHVDATERHRLVQDVAVSLGLGELVDRKPAELSGGQRQRVALARAIVRRPLVFLMDEPLSNLDAKLRVQTRAELIELHRRLGTTVIYVTHDQVEAMTMGDRIAVITDGVLQQAGPPQEVYDRPANVFVARFIGSPPMNTLAGTVEADGAGVRVAVPGGVVPLPDDLARAVRDREATAITLGVRPEHLVFDDDGPVEATVTLVESLGHERLVVCRVADGTLVIVRLDSDAVVPALESIVRVTTAVDHVHLFDADTSDRIEPAGATS